jgi:glucuronate isomerase
MDHQFLEPGINRQAQGKVSDMTHTKSPAQPVWQSIDNKSLMPLEPAVRDIANGLYQLVRELPIISPHGHVDPQLLLANQPFESAADLFIYHNHYITRQLHADGVSLDQVLRPSSLAGADLELHGRNAWSQFAARWHKLAATSSGYWFVRELGSVFGIDRELGPENADKIYDEIQAALARPEMLPRALFADFKIDVLATTDSPADNLSAHRDLAALNLGGRVAPTFRPDAFINPTSGGWAERVSQLVANSGQSLSQAGFVATLAERREFFKANGAFSVDIGAETAFTTVLEPAEAQRLATPAKRYLRDFEIVVTHSSLSWFRNSRLHPPAYRGARSTSRLVTPHAPGSRPCDAAGS